MIIVKRKPNETAVLLNRETSQLVAVIANVTKKGGYQRVGFHIPRDVVMMRTELTSLAGLDLSELLNVPFGTKVTTKNRQMESATLPT